jgi:two-component system chemotaxis sensor kinase CheA
MSDAVDPFEAIKAVFFQECDELLGDLEAGLLAIEAGSADDETVNAVFRAVHSVKGGAGAFGLDALVRFAHVFETLMDEVRSGRKPCDEATVKTLLRASDVLADHIAAARGHGEVDEARSAVLVAEMELLTHGEAAPAASVAPERAAADQRPQTEPDEFGFRPVAFDLAALGGPVVPASGMASSAETWRIEIRPRSRMYAHGNEAGLLLRELSRLGETSVTLDASALPHIGQLVAEEAYLAWTVILTTEAGEAAIREVFDFVESDCDLSIQAVGGPVSTEVPDAADDELDIASLLIRAQEEVAKSPPAILTASKSEFEPVVAVAASEAPTISPAGSTTAQAAVPAPASPPAATIRVDLERVDRLINVVGELVIQQAMLAQRVTESGLARSSGIAVGLEDLELLTREIQDSVMAIRAQPVKSVFQRMTRLVREVAEMTGKRVRLHTAGEDTEVDKTVVERLAEPITHMLRNAIDHGLETPEDRLAAGKPAEGAVRMVALHRSGRIVIEISDDGRGINRERVKGIAVSRGLIAEDAVLSDDEIDNLIFLPGFSTAETITDVSGRGVGMDVVRRSIQALGGRISISSTPGQGSTFTLSLPLTLAVLDGMVVSAADQTLVAPLTAIVESLTPRPQDIHYVGGHDAVIRFRDAFVPLIDVALGMGFRAAPISPETGVAMVIETESGQRAALLFDAIQGQRQVVIKSLETNYQQVDGVAAATILGDGRVALILDCDAIVASSRKKTQAGPTAVRPDLKIAS